MADKQADKQELIDAIVKMNPLAGKALTNVIASAEKDLGQPLSELGVMVLVAQMALTEIITRLERGDEVPRHVVKAGVSSVAQTLFAYFSAGDKAVSAWEDSDKGWRNPK